MEASSMMCRAFDSDDDMDVSTDLDNATVVMTDELLTSDKQVEKPNMPPVESVKALLGIGAQIPIFDQQEMVPKVRECPKALGVEARKGKKAADIEYTLAQVEMDNKSLDEVMYKAWALGAIFYTSEQKTRRSHHMKTNHSKQERLKREEMMELHLGKVDVTDIMEACFPGVLEKEREKNSKMVPDAKMLLKCIDKEMEAMDKDDVDASMTDVTRDEGACERYEYMSRLREDLHKQKEVQRTMALKRKERSSNSYVIAMPSYAPANGQSWLKRALARAAVSGTRKVKMMVCPRCKELMACKEGICTWYSREGDKCEIIDDALYVEGEFVQKGALPRMKLERGEACVHADDQDDTEFAYGHQTERLPMMRIIRAEATSTYLNSKILADYRFHQRHQRGEVVSDNPFGVYFQPATLLCQSDGHLSPESKRSVAVVGSLGDGYTLLPRRLFSGSFYDSMFALAKGHLNKTLFIDDAVGAHGLLSGDVERVCMYIVHPSDDVAQTTIWWMMGLCEYVSSTILGRKLLKECGMTVFDRELCSLLYDYARSEINRREKDKRSNKLKRQKVRQSKKDTLESRSMLSSNQASCMPYDDDDDSREEDEGGDHEEDDDNEDNDNNYDDECGGRRGGNSTDAYRQFQWWIKANGEIGNLALLNTLVSDSVQDQLAANMEVFERQIGKLPAEQANGLVTSEFIRGVCAGFETSQTRIAGLARWRFGKGESLRPIPKLHRRRYDGVSVLSTTRVDNEQDCSAVYLCDVASRNEQLAVLHSRVYTPLFAESEESCAVDSVYQRTVAHAKCIRHSEKMRLMEDDAGVVTARGVNNRHGPGGSSHMREARSQLKYGIHQQRQLQCTSTKERPCSMIVVRMMMLESRGDVSLVDTMSKNAENGARFERDLLNEPEMAPGSPIAVAFSSIATIMEAYASHHRGRSLTLAGHAEWGQPLTEFDQLCKRQSCKKEGARKGSWEEFSKKCYEPKEPKEPNQKPKEMKVRRRACYESDAALAKTTPPPFVSFNDVRMERIGDTTKEAFEVNRETIERFHAPYAVTFQIPMQNAVRLVDKLAEFKVQQGVKARHVLAMMYIATIKALDTNELAKEKNAGDKDVMRKNARGAPVNDCNTELCCSMEDVYWGGINNLTPTFDKTYRHGCYEWISHGSGPKGSDAGNYLSDNRKLGRSIHEGETSAQIYAMQLEHFFTQVGGDSSIKVDVRPDEMKFWPFANVAGVTKSMNTYADSKELFEKIAPVDKSMLPVLLAFPLSPDTQSIAPLVNPGNCDSGSKLGMSASRVPDFHPMGRADNVNATDEMLALLNPTLFRAPSSQSCIDMAKTDMTDYGATWKALHVLVARITKELVPNYETRGVHALYDLVTRYRSDEDLPSEQRVIATTLLVLLNLCNPREFGVAKPVIVKMYSIVAAMANWEDANGKTSEYSTLRYWRSRLTPEDVAEEEAWFAGYFQNGPEHSGAWGSVAPLHEAILARNGYHFQTYASAREFERIFTKALRESAWYASSPDGVHPPAHVDGEIHPLEDVRGPHEIRRRHLEPVYVGRFVRAPGNIPKQYVPTRGATFCVESFQATHALTLLTSCSSIPLIDPESVRGYGVYVCRNTGGMNTRYSVDANIFHWAPESKGKKRERNAGLLKSDQLKKMYRSAKSTSVDQVDHDEIQNGTIKDRRESHALQRIAANHNIRSLASTVSILNPPLELHRRMRGAEASENKLLQPPPVEDIEALQSAIVDPLNLESMRSL